MSDLFNNFDYVNSYKTQENLVKSLTKAGLMDCAPLFVIIPNGKNAGRHTAVFPFRGGENNHIIFNGYKVMG